MLDYYFDDENTWKRYYFIRTWEIWEDSIVVCPICCYKWKPKKVSWKLKSFSMNWRDALALAFWRIRFKYKKIPAHFECPRCWCCFLDFLENKYSKSEEDNQKLRTTLWCIVLLILIIFIVIYFTRRDLINKIIY